jgi:hypothetical protein
MLQHVLLSELWRIAAACYQACPKPLGDTGCVRHCAHKILAAIYLSLHNSPKISTSRRTFSKWRGRIFDLKYALSTTCDVASCQLQTHTLLYLYKTGRTLFKTGRNPYQTG